MTLRNFRGPLKAMANCCAVLVFGVMALLSFSQTAAFASTTPAKMESISNELIALAASSRFAAEAEFKNQEPIVLEERLDELKERRREWQSAVSGAANTEQEDTLENPIDDVVKNKLNLDEITQENEIVNELKNP